MYNNYYLSYHGYYYQEPSMLERFLLNYNVFFLVVGFLGFCYLLKWFIKKKDRQARYDIFKSVVLTSPIWFITLLFYLIVGITSISRGEVNPFVYLVTGIIIYWFIFLYYLIAVYPASITYNIISILSNLFGKKKKDQIFTFWSLLDELKRKRLFIFSLLIIILVFIILLDIYFLFRIISPGNNVSLNDYSFLPMLLIMSIFSLFFYALIEIFNYGKVNIPVTEHRKSTNLKRAIEKISLIAGVKPPDFHILAYNNPTVFSIFPNFGKPTIYITAPLLNMTDDDELEAVIAHEFAHIFSGRILYFKRIQNILIALKIFVFLFIFLLLINIKTFLVVWWFLLLSYSCINILEAAGEKRSSLETFFKLFNPPLALVNFFSYFIYYAAARNEEFYTDLKTIELTRYPAGIYSIIRKLENYTGVKERLPSRFSYLYFIAEDTSFNEIPMPQLPSDQRKELLKQVDRDLEISADVRAVKDIKCPHCNNLMDLIKVKGFYHHLSAYYCKKCEGFWFPSGSLHYVIDLNSDNINLKDADKKEVKSEKGLLCPHCGVGLKFLKNTGFPSDIVNVRIWRCLICEGDWLFKKDIIQYLARRR